jgi:hypothetical protein
MNLFASSAELMIAVSTPRIQRSKSCFPGRRVTVGKTCKYEPSSTTPAISSAKAEGHTFEQSASRCTGVYR